MAVYRLDAKLPYETHLPRDVAINTFHFQISGSVASGPQLGAMGDAVTAFYSDVPAGATESVSQWLSDYIDRSLASMTIYHVGIPGPPVGTSPLTMDGAASANSLPFEVAICGSYRAENQAGIPLASTRGRVYIGPLVNTAMTTSGGNPSRPNVDTVASIAGACDLLHDSAALAAESVEWVVYSRKLDEAWPVVDGWVDNEFDTQRRRGTDASDRVLWP